MFLNRFQRLRLSSMCEFQSYTEAQAFMAQLARLEVSYVSVIVTPPKRLKQSPYVRVTILEVANGGAQH
jgi:hypothetical protein